MSGLVVTNIFVVRVNHSIGLFTVVTAECIFMHSSIFYIVLVLAGLYVFLNLTQLPKELNSYSNVTTVAALYTKKK